MTQRWQSQTHHKFPQAAMMPHSTQKHTRTQTYACAVWFIVLMFVQGSDLSFLKPCLSHGRTSWWQKSSAIKQAKVWKRLQKLLPMRTIFWWTEHTRAILFFFFHGPQDNRIFDYFFFQFFAELQRIFRGIRCQAKRQESQRFLPETRGGFCGWWVGGGWLESSLIEVDNKLYDII